MNNILDFNLLELKIWMKEQCESEFRAKQVMDFLYKEVWDFDAMKNIPMTTKEKLKSSFFIGIPKIVEVFSSKEDETKKLLIQFEDGNLIETVIMKYKHGYSICVSTQIGCKMGCKFCASTLNGMVRNLSAGEILAQVLVAQKEIGERVSNVVLMGSGEPLDNYDNVIKFLELVNAEYGLNIGQRHITLSTCGIVPKILELAKLKLQITLAISLHAPEDNLRKTMMPIANKYTVDEIIAACKNYIELTNKRITFEYALVKGVNDSTENAKKLSQILRGFLCHVNLIPINEIKENTYKTITKVAINNFGKILLDSGIETTVRREMGSDIGAACGQLRRSYIETKKMGVRGMVGILSDIGNVRAENEDSAEFYEDEQFGIYIIADGMGGYNSGEIASDMAVKEVLAYIKANINLAKPEVIIKEAIVNANNTIYKASLENEEQSGMGTTITACILINGELIVGHVGDSSCLVLNNLEVSKLTKDHSLVQQLVDSGSITEAQALIHPNKNIITRALGTNDFVEIDIYTQSLVGIKKIILCTDGLSNFVSNNEIYDIIIYNNNEVASKKLIQLGKEKGSRDNLSVIVFEGEVI